MQSSCLKYWGGKPENVEKYVVGCECSVRRPRSSFVRHHAPSICPGPLVVRVPDSSMTPPSTHRAQKQLLARAQANSEAQQGIYKPGSQPSDQASLYVKNYQY